MVERVEQQSVQRNIESIVRLEQEALAKRTAGERVADVLRRGFGATWFVLAHLVGYVLWIAVNLGAVPGIAPFDRFPFGVLSFVIASETVFLTLFVLISQNRLLRQSEHRAHLELQINLLAEQEATKTLQIVQAIAANMGLHEHAQDAEARELAQDTEIEKLSHDLKQRLPDDVSP